jgi:hypothetical protein
VENWGVIIIEAQVAIWILGPRFMVRPPRAFDCYRRHICPNNTPNIISQMPIARARFTGIQFWKSAACVIYFQPRFSTLDPLTKCLISQSTLGLTFLDDCLCAVSRQNMFSPHAIAGASVTLFWLGPRPNPLISRPIVGRGLWKRETTRTQKKWRDSVCSDARRGASPFFLPGDFFYISL